jgi:hypothetical protein
MLQNIPTTYGYDDVKEEVKDFENIYNRDGLKFPHDFAYNLESNYCFIDFPTPDAIVDFYKKFEGRRWAKSKASNKARIAWAKVQEKSFSSKEDSFIRPSSSNVISPAEVKTLKRKLESPEDEVSNEQTNGIDELQEAICISKFIANHDADYVQNINDVKILLNNFLKSIPGKKCSVKGCNDILQTKCPNFYQEVKMIGFPRKFCARYPSLLKYKAHQFTEEEKILPEYVTVGDGKSPDYIPRKTFRR